MNRDSLKLPCSSHTFTPLPKLSFNDFLAATLTLLPDCPCSLRESLLRLDLTLETQTLNSSSTTWAVLNLARCTTDSWRCLPAVNIWNDGKTRA